MTPLTVTYFSKLVVERARAILKPEVPIDIRNNAESMMSVWKIEGTLPNKTAVTTMVVKSNGLM